MVAPVVLLESGTVVRLDDPSSEQEALPELRELAAVPVVARAVPPVLAEEAGALALVQEVAEELRQPELQLRLLAFSALPYALVSTFRNQE